MRIVAIGVAAVIAAAPAWAASKFESVILPPAPAPGAAVKPYVKTDAPRIALTHARVIDGTGAAAAADRTIVIENGRITAVTSDAPPSGTSVIDLAGHTVMPGLVGMHDHMYYIARPNQDAEGHSEPPLIIPQMTFSASRLYLASGVTTVRTTGSVEPYTDLSLKRLVDAGALPGPHMDVTGPYLEGSGSPFMQMHPLKDADDARKTVAFWADQGVTSFKAYMNITRAELKAAVEEAHRHGIKVTGHLCSVTYPEAAAIGIDDLEHGFFVNTQLDPGKEPDKCSAGVGTPTLLAMTPDSPEADRLIADLVKRGVTITSTLPVFEQNVPGHAPLSAKMLDVMAPWARETYLYSRNRTNTTGRADMDARVKAFRNALGLERKFVAAGGLMIAGLDPTGNGGTIPGFGDLREVELLVEAGFTPEQAIKIATYNGATYLGLEGRIGSIAAGRDADLLVVKGDPSKTIADIENVDLVFKDGIGYDPAALLASVRGRFGQY